MKTIKNTVSYKAIDMTIQTSFKFY